MAQTSTSSPSLKASSSVSNDFQKIIMALLIIVTTGYFILLILAPTNMYYQIWTPKIIAHTSNSTYFGAQGLLFERKESSVGVLVCGPKKMRHEVANICSSGLASNLHFESISFSW